VCAAVLGSRRSHTYDRKILAVGWYFSIFAVNKPSFSLTISWAPLARSASSAAASIVSSTVPFVFNSLYAKIPIMMMMTDTKLGERWVSVSAPTFGFLSRSL